jgi:hypothetical protein
MGLWNFLFGSRDRRDGSSPETAIVVASIAKEYEWMRDRCPGFRPWSQALHEIDGKPYDVLTWQNARGEERSVYFDISKFFGKF